MLGWTAMCAVAAVRLGHQPVVDELRERLEIDIREDSTRPWLAV